MIKKCARVWQDSKVFPSIIIFLGDMQALVASFISLDQLIGYQVSIYTASKKAESLFTTLFFKFCICGCLYRRLI